MLDTLAAKARSLFEAKFGEAPSIIVAAPGRVNLIGEHTDYNEGFVFPAAIDRHVVVAASVSPDDSKAWSDGFDEPAVFEARSVSEVSGWARFPAGCAWTLLSEGSAPSEINAVIVSNLPAGSGLSSSAAMELAFLTVWNDLDTLGFDPLRLALLGQQCEHKYVGVQCGVMDQMASALGKEGRAMLIDTRSLEVSYRTLPDDLCIVVCDTGAPRTLAGSKYNERLAECREACKLLGVRALRDATSDMVDGTLLEGHPVIQKRARHVVTENRRCGQFAQALQAGDAARIRSLMSESHESLKNDYEVSSLELDAMTEAGGNAPGCVGVRMTGAGFGGSCVALVRRPEAGEFVEIARRGYLERVPGGSPAFLTCEPAQGAAQI
ncbi:MAG TPA: galactokinase [Fimbriimonadaceae bacterium]|nr:galactokinase [Fimbriimonadaceae bacterium]